MKEEGRLDGPFEFGIKPVKQASKTDWKEVWDKAAAGDLMSIPDNIRVTHYTKLKAIAKDFVKVSGSEPFTKGHWWYGPSGSGKSSTARAEYPDLFQKLCNKWWDGYQGQETVLIEDVDPKNAEHLGYHLKLWGDHYHCPGETKGGMVALTHKRLIITSQYKPEEIWTDQQTLEAIHRRYSLRGFGVGLFGGRFSGEKAKREVSAAAGDKQEEEENNPNIISSKQ